MRWSRVSRDLFKFHFFPSLSYCWLSLDKNVIRKIFRRPSKKRKLEHFGRLIPRTLDVQYWERTDECLHRKWDHMDYIDSCYSSREDFILETVLNRCDIMLEPNMFPYDCGPNILHWTLWCKWELTDADATEYISKWLLKHMPHATEWNYDSNEGLRSIGLYHIHVYIRLPHEFSKEDLKHAAEKGGDDNLFKEVCSKYSGGCLPTVPSPHARVACPSPPRKYEDEATDSLLQGLQQPRELSNSRGQWWYIVWMHDLYFSLVNCTLTENSQSDNRQQNSKIHNSSYIMKTRKPSIPHLSNVEKSAKVEARDSAWLLYNQLSFWDQSSPWQHWWSTVNV